MLLVHVEHPSPRATYIVSHVIGRMLGLPFRMVDDRSTFLAEEGPRLHYGTSAVDGAWHVPWTGALERPPVGDPPLGSAGGLPVLFPAGMSFDLFAAAFFLLSLVDEQRCTARDVHDRVPTKELFVVRAGLADGPWLDRWALDLHHRLRERWPVLPAAHRRYTHWATVDIDNVLRYGGRPWPRALGATARDLARLRLGAAVERWLVRSELLRDPFLRALDLVEQHAGDTSGVVLFLLLHGGGPNDHAVGPEHWPAELHRFLRHDTSLRIGLHPSYSTSTDRARLEAEVATYERRLQPRARVSRQHFLRWRLPDTLRQLAAAGFTEEHSLGFADRAGFRAATCTPFPWYDTARETATTLELWPFQAMDSALIERRRSGPGEVVDAIKAMSDLVRDVNGTFVSVWHDRYLSGHREFAPWPSVFGQVIKHARP